MNPIHAPPGYKTTQIDPDTSVGFSPGQVFAFISSAMRSSSDKGCNCYIGWFILEIGANNERQNDRNKNAVKSGEKLLIQRATTLLVDHVRRERNRYFKKLNNFKKMMALTFCHLYKDSASSSSIINVVFWLPNLVLFAQKEVTPLLER